jgi:alpha-N-arabinofuranosidase
MNQILATTGVILALAITARATEFHVSITGSDTNPGSRSAPLRTIQHAADLAHAGDVITVHAGVYRERINPPRGGESEEKRIVYQAAPGEKVEVKGSEVVKDWAEVQDDIWKVTLPNSFFGSFNPFSNLIRGDWFEPRERDHHTGAVYLNGDWLIEAATLDDVIRSTGTNACWFGKVEAGSTTIWAQFKGVNPNEQLVEINVRQTVFYPDKPGRNFITVRGFTMRHAATPWAPPTAEQVGLIGTHWSKGWIIENNIVSHSTCSGIALGKYGDQFDNTSANTAEGYVKTIERAHAYAIPWSKENVGHHIIRNNIISDCEQTGIVGSLGCAFSTVTGNIIHDIHLRQLFGGAEMAGIKFHGAIDVTISRNHIYRTCRGIWLDWMAQGARVTGNLLHDNLASEDLFVEVDHGPFMVDNNLFLSPRALLVNSQGGAYVHNLMVGSVRVIHTERRQTPYHPPHSTVVAGRHGNPSGDDRYYNNLMVQHASLTPYDAAQLPVFMSGNVFVAGALPSRHEPSPLVAPGFNPGIRLAENGDGLYLDIVFDKTWGAARPRKLITTELLGNARIPDLPYENPDGSPVKIDTDYFRKPRNPANPTPGPFENPGDGPARLKVWGP